MHRNAFSLLLAGLCLSAAALACTQTKIIEENEPAAQQDGGSSGANPDPAAGPDPLAALSPDWQVKAASYLDGRAKAWLASPPPVANIACTMSCHTTFSVVMSRSALGDAKLPAADAARKSFEARVTEGIAGTATPFYGKDAQAKVKESHATEAVLNAAALSLDDLGSGRALSASTKSALDRMWSLQRADGAWDWLEFSLEPWETRNDWGAAMAALVAGSVPASTSTAQAAGTTKVIGYLKKRLTAMAMHDRITVLWASGALKGLLDEEQSASIVAELVATQRDDGGFAIGAWGKGDLADSKATSDGYATALGALALCRGTTDGAKGAEARKALTWLAKSQAADGSWPGRSLNSESARAKGFMTDAATSYASLAIATCSAK